MNKILVLLMMAVFISKMPFSLLAYTQETTLVSSKITHEGVTAVVKPLPNPAEPTDLEQNTSSQQTLRFTLQHRLNGGAPLPTDKIEIPLEKVTQQPRMLLEAIKQNFSTHLENQSKPLQIDTEVEWLLPQEMTQILGKLPKLSIQTRLNKDGTGKSQLMMPADKRKVTKADKTDQATIDWKGLKGLLTFTNQFQSIQSQLDFAGLTIATLKGLSFSWDATTFRGLFDANLRPSQMNLKLPLLKAHTDKGNQLTLQALGFQFNIDKTRQGLELGNLDLKVGQLGLVDEGSKFSLNNLKITSEGQEQDHLINYVVQTQMGSLAIPKNILLNEDVTVSYSGNLAIRRLDATALLALQKAAREVQSQNNPTIMGITLLAKLMEVAPQLLAKSPEMAFTNLSFKTPQGKMEGKINLRIDGNKATSLEPEVLTSALQVQSEFNLSKLLLEQLIINQWRLRLHEEAEKSANNQALSKSTLAKLEQQAQQKSEQQINQYLEQKWLVKTASDNYKLVMQLQAGKLMVNGQEKPLPSSP